MPNRYVYLAQIISGHLSGKLTHEEQTFLQNWLAQRSENQAFLDELENENRLQEKLTAIHEVDRDRLWALTNEKIINKGLIKRTSTIRNFRSFRKWIPYAAALLIATLTVSWYFLTKQPSQVAAIVSRPPALGILPDDNQATLTLPDGRTITLDEARNGIIVGIKGITYNDGNPLTNLGDIPKGSSQAALLALRTPNGKTYQIVLPDGSRVWLNAASTLKYPSQFTAQAREVELIGEGYFEIVKDPQRPFTVTSGDHQIRVLGTQFNVNAYPDEKELVATLVEGSVDVLNTHSKTSHLLKPGQQARLHQDAIEITDVNVSYYTSWKDGRFTFNREKLPVILRQIERWYDIKFINDATNLDIQLWGTLSREVTLSELLKVLEMNTGMKFKQEGRRVIVSQ